MKYNTHNQDDYLLQSNLLGAESIDELEQLERVAFYISSSKLENDGLNFLLPLSSASVKELHFQLFKNIYDFAGEIRDVSLMKGQTRFCEPVYIEDQLKEICRAINFEEDWDSLECAARHLAYVKTELNMIHPFREGNGRTIRLIIREIAKAKGFTWHFETLDSDEYLAAMISSQADISSLVNLFLNSLNITAS